MSDVFRNHIVGFPTRWLECVFYGSVDGEIDTLTVAAAQRNKENHKC